MSLCQNRDDPRRARVRAVTLDTMFYGKKVLSSTSFSGVFLAAGLFHVFHTSLHRRLHFTEGLLSFPIREIR